VCGDKRLGDFGISASSISSQTPATASSPLRLCLQYEVPSPNNSVRGDSVTIGDDLNSEIKDEPELEAVASKSCLKEDAACINDGDCCDSLECSKRDKFCKLPARQSKVSLDIALM